VVLAATSIIISLRLGDCGAAAHLAEGVRKDPRRRVPLTLLRVNLGRVAAQVGVGDTAGWDTRIFWAVLSTSNVPPQVRVRLAPGRATGGGTWGVGRLPERHLGRGAASFTALDAQGQPRRKKPLCSWLTPRSARAAWRCCLEPPSLLAHL
jgi:hypothetical protein